MNNRQQPVAFVQLPFPSQEDPLPQLFKYYNLYQRKFNTLFPEYQLNEGDLWELPLWIAHMDGAVGRDDSILVDASKVPFQTETCIEKIIETADPSYILFFSPLTQNFDLAKDVSRRLRKMGYKTVVGGNMADLAKLEDFTWMHTGLARERIYQEMMEKPEGGRIGTPVKVGKNQIPLGYRPRYRLLSSFRDKVPLLRFSASHGCLFTCTFCGDAWTKQLHEVEKELLKEELEELRSTFPSTKLIYIGDKTFGQSKKAVENLKEIIHPGYGYRLIVQTHVLVVDEWLMDTMEQLGVEVVEVGFETADSTVLKEISKRRKPDVFINVLEQLKDRGFHCVLNVLGGLPNETVESQKKTIDFLYETKDLVWLYNLYNFVPYPKTPLFPIIRDRIIDWNFKNWREDKPVVFEPYHQSRNESWEHFLRLIETCSELLEKSKEESIVEGRLYK
ncbi:B12-binding domain-containing radical SAM protein [Desmospora profundinema]|uniref:Radical SAM superfamily protein n=1 Tax=Desmospora profundinema TaxID=1571184 RepID=A0ABU1IJ01_9BACL|nr:radical SAM protein [Desmospora profundinema]MDR6224749.1 putative radical SAM superfamily protein [Desmospora profundinema]